MLDIIVIVLGLIFSFFLKDISFLSLQFDFFKSGSIYPDFLLIYLIYFSLRTNELSAIWLGFFAGLLEDSTILSFNSKSNEYMNIIGIHTMVYPIMSYILAKINKYIDIDNIQTIIIVTFISSFLTRISIWFLMGIVDRFYDSFNFLGPSLYTSILSPAWFFFLKWIYHRKEL